MNINKLLENIYYFIVWVNKNIFTPLNGNTRIDAFIGILGMLVAIVIFVAETMNDKNAETQKRFILEKTKMKSVMVFSVVILSLCILKEIIPYSDKHFVQIIYFFEESLLNAFICYSIFSTLKLFKIIIKLNTDSDYFLAQYDEYIKNRLNTIHKRNIKVLNKSLKNESVNKFVKENKKYFSFRIKNVDEYVEIKANKSGIFKSYSCRALQAIIDKIDEESMKKKELVVYSKPLILLNLKEGVKLNRGVTIAYCLKDIKNYADSIRNACLLNDSVTFQDNEINLILNDLYFLAESNMVDTFDSDCRLFDFYNYLYENNMRALLDVSYEYIRKIYIKCYKDINKNNEFANFLSTLASLAYSNGDYDRYKFLINYIYYCYTEQLKLSDDIRDVSYKFTNALFRYDYYSIKENSDSIYYGVLISNLLRFLFDLIMKKEFKAIDDLFVNVIFDYSGVIDDEPDSYDIINLQFSFGFIYGLIILSDKGIFDDDDRNCLQSLIRIIKNNFVGIYSQNEAIDCFKKYYYLSSDIQEVYCDFDFRFENRKYRKSWHGTYIDDVFILKEFIYLFGIGYSTPEDISLTLISKDKKYFYEKLLGVVKSDEKSKLDMILSIDFNKDALISLLENLVAKCKKAEDEFIKSNKISVEKTICFKNAIFKEIEKGNELITYLKDNKKYSIVAKKSRRLFGFNQILGRELFFEDFCGFDNLSKDYGRAILSGVSKDYLKKLDSISNVIKENFTKYIECLDKTEEYVIITSPSNWQILNTDNFNDKTIVISNMRMDLIRVPKARDIYLIRKKDLPKINMFEPDILESGTYSNGVYYELVDCSTNVIARNEILKNTKWLAEKGNVEEQVEYLKGKCVFKLFISPSIRKVPNSKCYKFIIEEGDKYNV